MIRLVEKEVLILFNFNKIYCNILCSTNNLNVQKYIAFQIIQEKGPDSPSVSEAPCGEFCAYLLGLPFSRQLEVRDKQVASSSIIVEHLGRREGC